MNIVFTIKDINKFGGIERATVLVANALVERGHHVTIISFAGSGTTPFFEIDKKVQVIYLSTIKNIPLVRDIRRIISLKRLYRQINPDIIILAGTKRALVNLPAARGYRVITCEHSSVSRHQHSPKQRLVRYLSAKYSECIVTPTQWDAEEYKRQFGAKRTLAIPNPLTLQATSPASLEDKVVLSVGRLEKVKGYDLLLKAWSQVQHKDWILRIVGGGKCEQKLREQIQKNNIQRVELVGASRDVAPYYQRAAIYALSSRSESFGLVLTEAMTFGLPIVAFDCGAGPREIVKNEVTGLIVPAKDTAAMARALDKLMEDTALRHTMGENALQELEKYSMESIIMQWETLFKQIIDHE